MATSLDQIRENVRQDAESAAKSLEALYLESFDAANKIKASLDLVRTVKNNSARLAQADPLPVEFTGRISGYRFGMTANEQRPQHRFEVEVPGVIWLHVTVDSTIFDEFITRSEFSGEFTADDLDGKLVMVKRTASGRIIPIKLVDSTDQNIAVSVGAPLTVEGYDNKGIQLFKGDLVKLRPNTYRTRQERIFTAAVLDFDGAKWTFQRKDRVNPTIIRRTEVERYVQFEKLSN